MYFKQYIRPVSGDVGIFEQIQSSKQLSYVIFVSRVKVYFSAVVFIVDQLLCVFYHFLDVIAYAQITVLEINVTLILIHLPAAIFLSGKVFV